MDSGLVTAATRVRVLASCVLGLVLLHANVARGVVIACNQADVYAQMPSCTSTSNPCVINDTVICGGSCGPTCDYNFGDTKPVTLSGNLGAFVNASFIPKNIYVTTGSLTTTGENVVRFEAGGSGAYLEVVANTAAVNLFPGQMRNTGSTAGTYVYVRGRTAVYAGKVDSHATGSADVGGGIILATPGDLFIEDPLDASGPGGGGGVFLQGNRIYVLDDVNAKATSTTSSTGTAGNVQLLTVADFVPSQPLVQVSAPILASVTASASGQDGGTIFIGPTPGSTWEPTITISEAVNATATLGDGGSITVEGLWVSMNATPSALNAASGSNVGTHGGTINVTTTGTTNSSFFRTLDVRGHHAGTIKMLVAGELTQFDKDVRADSNQGPDGVGGVISVRTAADNGTPGCWDCQEPNDSCACGVPPSCTQKIQINEDFLVNGNGVAGDGGVIVLEAPFVYMRASSGSRRLMANASTATDSSAGDQPGRVRVRARDSQFRARTDGGTDHKIRGLPDRAGVTEICITQPYWGDYKPFPPNICGPTYAPQCSPG